MSALDNLNGGAGSDTLNIVDGTAQGATSLALATALTVSGIENLSVVSNQNIGSVVGSAAYDVSGFTGLTSAKFVSTGTTNGSYVKVAGTTGVDLTVSANDAKVAGGNVVSVTNAGAGATSVSGAALTSVSVKGGGAVTVDNTSAAGTSGAGSTLTAVTLDGAVGTVSGKGVATLNLSNLKAAADVAVTNSTTDHGITVVANAVGYDASGSAVVVSVSDAVAKTITVTAISSSNLSLAGVTSAKASASSVSTATALRSVVINGAANVKLDLNGAASNTALLDSVDNTGVTSIDASAATGNVTLTEVAATVTSIKGGSAVDTFTVTNGSSAVTVASGAGNDSVTIGAAITATSSVDLGAGDDTLTVSTAYTDGATIAAGDGTDTLVVSAANYATLAGYGSTGRAKVTGFEALTINSTVTGTAIDASKIAGVNAKVTLGDGLTSATTLSGLVSGSSVVVAGTARVNSTLTADVTGAVLGTADSLTITGNVSYTDNNDTSVNDTAATVAVSAANVETLNLVASAKISAAISSPVVGYKADTVTTTFDLTGSNAVTSVVITGAQKAAFATTAAMDHLALIDASANTGGVTIDGSLSAATSAALTIKGSATGANILTGGSAADTLVGGAGKDSLTGGAAADSLNGGAGNDTLTGGIGADALTGGTGRDAFAYTAGDSINSSTGFDKIADFGLVTSALTATQSAALTSTVATAQAATTDNGGADADILDVAGTASLLAASVITQANGTTMSALTGVTGSDIAITDDIKIAVSSKGVVSLSGADAGKVNTLAEWTALIDSIDGSTAGTTSAFAFGGNTYVQTEGATDTLVELTGVALGSGNGLALLGASTAIAAGDLVIA